MKKILLYIAVAIVIVSCGVSIYYVVRNNENIYATLEVSQKNYLNLDEEIDIPVVHEKPNSKTTLTVECESSILQIDTENWKMKAVEPGVAEMVVTSSNSKFGPFKFVFYVGNGSIEYPYYIRNESDLKQIGNNWGLSENYELVCDINMSEQPFEPIGSTVAPFNGTFSGSSDHYAINNLFIDKAMEVSQPVGLFVSIGEDGKVEDLKINNAKVIAQSKFSGIIAGRNYGTIGKCEIENSSIMTSGLGMIYSGLVCGLNESKNRTARVSLCSIEGEIYSSYVAGGIVGYNKGGIIDNNDITLNNVEIIGDAGEGLFGGIVGYTMNGSNGTSIIMNNLVKIKDLLKKNALVGGVIGETLASNVESRGYYSMLIYNHSELLAPVGKNVNDVELSSSYTNALNYVANATKTDIISKETYTLSSSTWDFKKLWHIEEGKLIRLDYENENFDYQTLPITGSIIEISSNSSLKNAINNMRAYPSAKITYKIMGESIKDEETGEITEEKTYTFNVNNGDWEPIGTKEEPFAGQIIAEKDATLTIKKANIKGTIAGLFGYVSQNAYISNINVVDSTYEGTMIGGIAGYNNGAKIENCLVKNADFTTTKYAGSICGYSVGSIENCLSETIDIFINEEKERNIYIGGIVGKSKGNINNSNIDTLKIDVSFESENNTICLGGIAGHIENANIINSQTIGFSASAYRYLGRIYGGGIVGYSVKSNINKCGVSESYQPVNLNTENICSLLGGIVGYQYEGIVRQSAVCGIALRAYSTAGIVSFCEGEISECYSGTSTTIEGKYVGGLTVNLHGKIKNSYSISSLLGSEVSAGLTTYLWKGSEINNCYTYCSFGEYGDNYADTFSNYKGNPSEFGNINNTLIVGNSSQDLAKPSFTDWYKVHIISRDGTNKVQVQVVFFLFKGTFNYISEDELLGGDNYTAFKELDFDTNIWSFGDKKNPLLKDVYDLGESATNAISHVQEGVDAEISNELAESNIEN